MYTRTFAQFSDAVQKLGGWENSIDITPDVLLQVINDALVEGYDTMVQKWADYYTLDTTLTLVAGQDTYSLASVSANFYKLRHVDVSPDGSRFYRAYPYDLDTQHIYTAQVANTMHGIRYRVQAQNLIFAPKPTAGVAKLYYIPQPQQFASTADVTALQFDVPAEARLVVHIAHRDLLERSDLSTVSAERQIERLVSKLQVAADARDAGEAFSLLDNPNRDELGSYAFDGWDW